MQVRVWPCIAPKSRERWVRTVCSRRGREKAALCTCKIEEKSWKGVADGRSEHTSLYQVARLLSFAFLLQRFIANPEAILLRACLPGRVDSNSHLRTRSQPTLLHSYCLVPISTPCLLFLPIRSLSLLFLLLSDFCRILRYRHQGRETLNTICHVLLFVAVSAIPDCLYDWR